MEAQPLPQADELERAVLGAILLNGQMAMSEVAEVLVEGAFYAPAHAVLFRSLAGMYERSEPIDLLTVCHDLKKNKMLEKAGGVFYISTLTNSVASAAHIHRHAFILMEHYIAREAIKINADAMSQAYAGEDALDLVASTVARMEATVAASAKKRAITYAKAEESQLDELNKPKQRIHSTGFEALDNAVGGFRRGDLIVIAGRPGMGKTSCAFSFASAAADRGYPTGMLSMELNEKTGQARLFAGKSGVPLEDIVNDRLTEVQIQKRHELLGHASGWPLWIRYDSNMSLTDIRAEATRMKRHHDIGCIFIDQLNWIKPPKAANRDGAVGEITRTLKNIAMELNIAIVLLHQLNRDVEKRGASKKPQLSDLRDSGNVEQDSQVVLFPYRPEYYGITEDEFGSTAGVMHIIISKNSNGAPGTVRLGFDGPTASVIDGPMYQQDNQQPF